MIKAMMSKTINQCQMLNLFMLWEPSWHTFAGDTQKQSRLE